MSAWRLGTEPGTELRSEPGTVGTAVLAFDVGSDVGAAVVEPALAAGVLDHGVELGGVGLVVDAGQRRRAQVGNVDPDVVLVGPRGTELVVDDARRGADHRGVQPVESLLVAELGRGVVGQLDDHGPGIIADREA